MKSKLDQYFKTVKMVEIKPSSTSLDQLLTNFDAGLVTSKATTVTGKFSFLTSWWTIGVLITGLMGGTVVWKSILDEQRRESIEYIEVDILLLENRFELNNDIVRMQPVDWDKEDEQNVKIEKSNKKVKRPNRFHEFFSLDELPVIDQKSRFEYQLNANSSPEDIKEIIRKVGSYGVYLMIDTVKDVGEPKISIDWFAGPNARIDPNVDIAKAFELLTEPLRITILENPFGELFRVYVLKECELEYLGVLPQGYTRKLFKIDGTNFREDLKKVRDSISNYGYNFNIRRGKIGNNLFKKAKINIRNIDPAQKIDPCHLITKRKSSLNEEIISTVVVIWVFDEKGTSAGYSVEYF